MAQATPLAVKAPPEDGAPTLNSRASRPPAACEYSYQPKRHQRARCRFGNVLSRVQPEGQVLRMGANSLWTIGKIDIVLRQRIGHDDLVIDACTPRGVGQPALNRII